MISLRNLVARILGRYPHKPGSKRTKTSRQAAASMATKAPMLRTKCLQALSFRAMTADEVAQALGESVLAVRPRITELRLLGQVEATRDRRPNVSGRAAIVWRAI